MSGFTATALLAQMSRWSRLGDGLRPGGRSVETSTFLAWAIVAALAGLVAILYVQYRKRNDMSERCDDPEKLFRELCLAHQLTAGSQRVLRQLAAARGFEQPAQIFLAPSAFDAGDLSGAAGASESVIADLRSRLYG